MYQTATILRAANINNTIRNGRINVSGRDGDSDIVIEGGTWDGNTAQFSTSPTTAIAFGHAKRITVRGVTVRNIYNWYNIEFNAMQDGQVIDCYFFDMTFSRQTQMVQLDLLYSSVGYPWGGNYDNTPCQNILIQGRVFRNGPRAIGSQAAITGFVHKNTRIVDFYFENMAQEAIYMYDWSRVVVKGCQFENCGRGVYATAQGNDCTDIVITDSEFHNIAKDGQARPIMIVSNATGRNRVIKGNVIGIAGRHRIGVDYSEKWSSVL